MEKNLDYKKEENLIKRTLKGIREKYLLEEKKDTNILENLRKAHKEWQLRENYFKEVTDPDLIDYAIYQMEASRLKYIYLLKKIKEGNIE